MPARNREHLRAWEPERDPEFYTAAHWRAQIARAERDFAGERGLALWLFERRHPERVAGLLRFSQIFRDPFQACYLGYSLDRELEGRGRIYQNSGFALIEESPVPDFGPELQGQTWEKSLA